MASNQLDRKLAKFLREKRGDLTFQRFSVKMGLPASTLHRLETCDQSATLGKLEEICKRLNCSIVDIFGK